MTFPVLLLLFTVIPAVEIGLFVVVGGEIGPASTVAVVLFTGIAGAALARIQGLRVLQQLQEALSRGAMPTDELVDGAIVLVGGTLLLTPGFMTDAFGLSCLVPVTRGLVRRVLKASLKRRVTLTSAGHYTMGGFRFQGGGVHPGPGAHRPEPSDDPAPLLEQEAPKTIDAQFSLIDEDEPAGD